VPFLDGNSAGEVDFSRDGKWLTYVTYPTAGYGAAESMAATNSRWPPHLSVRRCHAGLRDGTYIVYVCFSLSNIPAVCIVGKDGGAG